MDLLQKIIEINSNTAEILKKIDKKKIGIFSIFIPEEIFLAADIIPFRVNTAGKSSYIEGSNLLHPNMCSYILAALDEGLKGTYDFAEGVVLINDCDAKVRLYDVWNEYANTSYNYFMFFPRDKSEISFTYFKSQLEELIYSIEKDFNCSITEEALKNAISLCNKTRRLLQQLYQLRKENRLELSSYDAMQVVNASMCGLKSDFNQKVSELLDAVERCGSQKSERKHRVLLYSSYFNNQALVKVIEDAGTEVVCEYYNLKYFEHQIEEQGNPIDAIVHYYLDKYVDMTTEANEVRVDKLMKAIEEYDIDSVVIFTLKFCENKLMELPFIKKELMYRKIPVLNLEIEWDFSNIQIIKNRIQSFYEILFMN